MSRVRVVLVWVFSILIAWVMVKQGWPKFFADGRWTRSFAEWGYPVWFRMLVGVLEVGGAAAVLITRTALYGAVAIGTVMVGAVGTLLWDGRGLDALSPAIYAVVMTWIAWERRHVAWHAVRDGAGMASREAT